MKCSYTFSESLNSERNSKFDSSIKTVLFRLFGHVSTHIFMNRQMEEFSWLSLFSIFTYYIKIVLCIVHIVIVENIWDRDYRPPTRFAFLPRIKLTKFGNASTQNVFFLPKYFKIAMNMKFPTTPPMYVAAPTHDAVSLLIGPFVSGVSSDCSTNRDGDSHPIDPP